MIEKSGRFRVYRVLPPGGGCKNRWYQIGREGFVCSGWIIPSRKKPTKLPQWTRHRRPVSRVVSSRAKTVYYRNTRRLLRGRAKALRGLAGFGVVGKRVWGDRVYLQTMEGAWVPQAVVRKAPSTSLVGTSISRRHHLPIAFTVESRVPLWSLRRGKAVLQRGTLGKYSVRRVYGTHRLETKCYVRIGPNRWVACGNVRVASEPRPAPKALRPGEKWIDIDAENSVLYAREGNSIRRIVLVSLSKRTPRGVFRIDSKHIAMTLHNQRHRTPWYLEKVPYVAFFHKSFAIHGAYWHDDFGVRDTHGCVNLSPTDARWVFEFLEPRMPRGYVRINSTPLAPGTLIRITGGNAEPSANGGNAEPSVTGGASHTVDGAAQ